jgi:hypothetical protein
MKFLSCRRRRWVGDLCLDHESDIWRPNSHYFSNMLWKDIARIKNVLYNRDARHKSVSFVQLSDNSGDRRSLTLLS